MIILPYLVLSALKVKLLFFGLFNRGILNPKQRSRRLLILEEIDNLKSKISDLRSNMKKIRSLRFVEKDLIWSISRKLKTSTSSPITVTYLKSEDSDKVLDGVIKKFSNIGWNIEISGVIHPPYGGSFYQFSISEKSKQNKENPSTSIYR